jgi:hypothetical protein
MFVMLMKESHVFLKLDVDESNPASALLAGPSSLYLGNLITSHLHIGKLITNTKPPQRHPQGATAISVLQSFPAL